jgi:hypothetical protein
LTTSPFAKLSASIFPSVMQAYNTVMIVLVAVGTIYDVLHKKSARNFVTLCKSLDTTGTRASGSWRKRPSTLSSTKASVC